MFIRQCQHPLPLQQLTICQLLCIPIFYIDQESHEGVVSISLPSTFIAIILPPLNTPNFYCHFLNRYLQRPIMVVIFPAQISYCVNTLMR